MVRSDIVRYEGRTDKNEKYNNEINSRKDNFYPFFLSQAFLSSVFMMYPKFLERFPVHRCIHCIVIY